MAGSAIQVRGVSKRYALGGGPYLTLRETLAGAARGRRGHRDEIWALQDLTFDVDEGEVLGVIGLNGAGKSTLLKILSRITEPTSGRSRTRGRVGALLEVGTGFHPELSGRENIFLNGVILGLRRADIRRRFDEIVAFAGVEQFLDTPLKRYSSGMYLRLAFAVAAHVDPDIVIVDEVLAVGDVQFRQRCLGQMTEFAHEGRTVVFVSHDLGSVNQICARSIWLDDGRLRMDGPTTSVIEEYVRSAVPRGASVTFDPEPAKPVELRSAAVLTQDGALLDVPRRDEPFVLELRFVVHDRIPALSLSFVLETSQGVRILDEDWGQDTGQELMPRALPQEYVARMVVPPILAPGDYVLVGWVGTEAETILVREVLAFTLWPGPRDTSEAIRRIRIVQPDVQWDVEAVDPASRDESAEAER
ncbi:MAG: ABC transporter ATP-binding protein [Actinomycetota bacterium]|nr:ABC transporter ATP-binding protein [Actinomycetota bacterium]